jgi:LysM repeat protein
MLRRLVFFVMLAMAVRAGAQSDDSLFVAHKGVGWLVKYTVKPGENPHMLAQRFYITDADLAYANEVESLHSLTPGQVINIPVKPGNYYTTHQPMSNNHEVYYHVVAKDDISILSTYAGITKSEMRAWNNMKGNTLVPGQTMFMGWVKMIAKDTSDPASVLVYPTAPKPVAPTVAAAAPQKVPGGLDTAFNRLTDNGVNVLTEKGSAVFFDKPGKNTVYYAFHNTLPRNSIVKVFNPGTGKTIYVKILGPIPNTKQFANCIIGITSAAKDALGAIDNKAWCELSYAPSN